MPSSPDQGRVSDCNGLTNAVPAPLDEQIQRDGGTLSPPMSVKQPLKLPPMPAIAQGQQLKEAPSQCQVAPEPLAVVPPGSSLKKRGGVRKSSEPREGRLQSMEEKLAQAKRE